MIDAVHRLAIALSKHVTVLTFEKLLACVFLKQSLVGDWCFEIADHKIKHRQDLFLGIAGELGESRVLS